MSRYASFISYISSLFNLFCLLTLYNFLRKIVSSLKQALIILPTMSNPGDCAICLDVRNNPAMTPCMHVFCRTCIGSWLDRHSACPICRHRITRGRRALTTVRDNTTPRRASSAPATPPQAAPAAAAARGPARRVPRLSQTATASSATARAGNAAVARAATNTAAATRDIVPQHRRSNARSAQCTYRCPVSERQALIRSGG